MREVSGRGFVQRSAFPFDPHPEFRMADLDGRGVIYRPPAARIRNPNDILQQAGA
jgi:hypothetical protein